MNIQDLATDYLALHNDYATALAAENKALTAMDVRALPDLLQHRMQLAGPYETALQRLADMGEAITTLSGDIKDKLRVAQESFVALSEENLKVLDNVKAATENVMKLIVGAVQQSQTQKTVFYNAYGTVNNHAQDGQGVMLDKKS